MNEIIRHLTGIKRNTKNELITVSENRRILHSKQTHLDAFVKLTYAHYL